MALEYVKSVDFESVEKRLRGYDISRLLVIYTGGTIGMKDTGEGYVPVPNYFGSSVRQMSLFHEVIGDNGRSHRPELPFLFPTDRGHRQRIIYAIYEYTPLLDSSDMTHKDWVRIGRDIADCYELFHGFVILHGTDTLAYTASALSFMLRDLGKSVIITGAQIPIYEVRSDGRDNFAGALMLAGYHTIPEVTVFFSKNLYRGNRVTKVSTEAFNAFACPNFEPLVETGVNIEIHWERIFKPSRIKPFSCWDKVCEDVAILRLFPSITAHTLATFLLPPIRGLVIQSYGSGNIPVSQPEIKKVLQDAVSRNVLIVNISQCLSGKVMTAYAGGRALLEAGVITGGDMTVEAALTKLAHVLTKDHWSYEKRRHFLMTNCCGELTESATEKQNRIVNQDVIKQLADVLCLTSIDEATQVASSLLPALMCSATKQGDLERLRKLCELGYGHYQVADYDERTPLHVAASEGHEEIVKFLLEQGALVHQTDRYGNCALDNAVSQLHFGCIEQLRAAGAHLHTSSQRLGLILGDLAASDNVAQLQAYKLAHANLDAQDYDGRTALHVAVSHGSKRVVAWLLEQGCRRDLKDACGITPYNLAHQRFSHMLELFDLSELA